MERRTALRIIALSALAPRIDAFGAPGHPLLPEGTAWTAGDYKLQYFTAAENDLVDQLAEIIIPADAHSPGAHAVQVSFFADHMIATGDEATKAKWRKGLRLFHSEVAKSSPVEAIAKASAHEGHPTNDLERFFKVFKAMTVNGYYTSKIGIDQELEYVGNTYVMDFPGFPPLV
jgi:hypothetical protein